MKNQMKHTIVRILTRLLGLETLRNVYRWYITAASFIKYGDGSFPRIVSIEVNTHCNRACSYCPNSFAPQKARLIATPVFEAIVERLREIKYGGVVDFIFFSEPLLHPMLADLVRRVKERVPWCMARICTNGDLLTVEKVRELLRAGLDRIYVMRHNPTPDGWRDNISKLDKMFPGIFVRMDIDDVEREQGLHDFEGTVKVNKVRAPTYRNGRPSCTVHTHCAQIGVNGDWILCCVDYGKTMTFGNIIHESFFEIWNKPGFVSVRSKLKSGVPVSSKCAKCPCLVDRTNAVQIKSERDNVALVA